MKLEDAQRYCHSIRIKDSIGPLGYGCLGWENGMKTLARNGMKTLARIGVFAALIGGLSLANARADDTSVYVAGKAKYCKETAASGYLDCFYASLDACQKHNKSTNVRCVANPNSGT